MSQGNWDQYRRKPQPQQSNGSADWERYRRKKDIGNAIENQRGLKGSSHPVLASLLGFGQFGEDIAKGYASGAREMEVPVPEQWKPEKIRKSQSLEIGEYPKEEKTPSFNLEQYIDPQNKTAFNVGRYGPAIATLGITGAKSAKGFAKSLTNSSVGNKIVKDANMRQGVFNERYRDFFGALPSKVEVPPKNVATKFNQDIPLEVKDVRQQELAANLIGEKNVKKFKNGVDDELYQPLKEVMKNPSIENKHKAKTSANEAIREFDHKKATTGLDQKERSARTAAIKIKNRLIKSIDKDLKKAGPEFKEEYKRLTKEYREYMAPYIGNRDIRRARAAPSNEFYINPRRLPGKLAGEKGDPFMAQLAEQYPELSLNRALAGPIGKTLLGGSVGGSVLAALLSKLTGDH